MSDYVVRVFDPEAPPGHPLDSLTPGEIKAAATAVRAHASDGKDLLFSLMLLDEPPRGDVRLLESPPRERRIRVVTLNQNSRHTEEWTVVVPSGQVVGHEDLTAQGITAQPPIIVDEFMDVESIVKESSEWQNAVRRRGVEDFELIQVDPMSGGNFGFENEKGLRIIRAVSYLPRNKDDNAYAHPIDGLVTYVDLTNKRVLAVVDDELLPIPEEDSNFHDDNGISPRTDLKPLEIHQPEGPSFTVDDWEVSWQKWSFRVSMNAREGMVLHDITYDDDGTKRSILSRAAFAEMVVPYGDPRPSHFWRSAFDVGEYGLGALANSLTLGCDCLGSIYYFDTYMCDGQGEPYTLERSICLHEEDFGVLWRGTNWRYGGTWVRRTRRLVISFWATVGNYDYGFFWYFYQDGTIECEVKLTGIIQTAYLAPGDSSPYLGRVAPELAGQHHQHMFCVRLDPAVDGPLNSVMEVDAVPVPMGVENPYGNAIRKMTTIVERESQGRRETNLGSARTWQIINEDQANDFGSPVAFKLSPAQTAMMIADADSSVARRATFAKTALWVTRYSPDERFPSGDYPNLSSGGEGLVSWMKQDRDIRNQPIVVWHSFGTTHFARPEDWPVMPVERIGFMLKPFGFFRRNPALDVPTPESKDSCH